MSAPAHPQLEPGRVYRTRALAAWGANAPRLAKRLVRELFRHHKPDAGVDVVVVPRREMLDAPYARLEAEFCMLLSRKKP